MRFGHIDIVRTTAILWMIIFHSAYDMKVLGFVNWNFSSGFWYYFPRIIAFTFLFCVGMSLNFSYSNGVDTKKLMKRCLKLALCAGVISLSTYFIFPASWIYFGTLHCICVGSFLGAFLVNRRKLAWILLFMIVIMQYFLNFDIKWVSSIIQKPSMDFIPIYPWFWAILLGLIIGPYLSKIRQIEQIRSPKWVNFMSQNSLKIYLIHQPIIFSILWVIKASLK